MSSFVKIIFWQLQFHFMCKPSAALEKTIQIQYAFYLFFILFTRNKHSFTKCNQCFKFFVFFFFINLNFIYFLQDLSMESTCTNTWKSTAACTPQQGYQTPHSAHEQMVTNYTKLISEQNKVLTKLSMTPSVSPEEEFSCIQKIRDEANTFIRNLLQQLTNAYVQMRKNKREQEEEMGGMREQLENQKEKYEALKHQFYQQWQTKNRQQNEIIGHLDQQIEHLTAQYEDNLRALSVKLETKSTESEMVKLSNKQLKEKLYEKEKVIHRQRLYGNEQGEELSGMKKLIIQYQETIKYQEQKNRHDQQQIQLLKNHIVQLEITKQAHEKTISKLSLELEEKTKQLIQAAHEKKQQLIEIQHKQELQIEKMQHLFETNQGLKKQLQHNMEKNNQLSLINRSLVVQAKELEQGKAELSQKLSSWTAETQSTIKKVQEKMKLKKQLIGKILINKLKGLKKEQIKLKEKTEKSLLTFMRMWKVEVYQMIH